MFLISHFSAIFLFLSYCYVESFIISTSLSNNIINNKKNNGHLVVMMTIQETSDELVRLLLSPDNKKEHNKKERTDKIQNLVDTLVNAKVTFDLKECIDGPLYFSNVIEGPSPLWERLGLSSSNIQGQQYTYTDDEKSVINYAQVFGKTLHLRAYGTFQRDEESYLSSLKEGESDGVQDNEKDGTSLSTFNGLSFLDGLSSIIAQSIKGTSGVLQSNDTNLVQCPADFIVSVNRASIYLENNPVLDIPISGKGYLRVLYADKQLRIFVSPKSTTDDRWEKAGLKVAQVCIDLLDPEFPNLT